MNTSPLIGLLEKYAYDFYPVIPFDSNNHRVAALDLSTTNGEIHPAVYASTETLHQFIEGKRTLANATYLIGGYNEQRDMYRRSNIFDTNKDATSTIREEPRSIHLGTDVWGPIGTPVHVPIGGMVHSFAMNEAFGDYGATIILQHQLEGLNFYTLYGHLSGKDLSGLSEAMYVSRGQLLAHFGPPEENGQWPPHLHFQIIQDLGNWIGDYPGVCKASEAKTFLSNCPDGDLMLKLKKYL
jgi:murein DD-endopeptidase MepM/ murein hydrolase activator NlpD